MSSVQTKKGKIIKVDKNIYERYYYGSFMTTAITGE